MDELAARLRQLTQSFDLSHVVFDATGIEGGWDFTVTWSPARLVASAVHAENPQGVESASDPTGTMTLAEALNKQLGLKLEVRKRVIPLLVIDHINRQPTEN